MHTESLKVRTAVVGSYIIWVSYENVGYLELRLVRFFLSLSDEVYLSSEFEIYLELDSQSF